MKRALRQQGKTAFDLIEEATHLLRTAPAATLAIYYAGAVPFVLGLLYFWTDMSRSPFANQHLVEAALGMGALFIWMKFSQAVFTRRIRARVSGEPQLRMNFRNARNFFLAQTIIQPIGLFIIPLSLIAILPFAWVYAFFQNVTVFAGNDEKEASSIIKKSMRQAALWPRQNLILLCVMLAFSVCVFLNWATFSLVLPGLFKMLLGVQSTFSRSILAMLNTTFFAGMTGLTYLCVDPILKTIYTLRCFYGEALQSGEDLKAELKSFGTGSQNLAAALLILLAVFFFVPAKAAETSAAPSASQKISSTDLEHAIAQTVHGQKYAWRMPREKVVESDSDEGVVARFFDKISAMFRRWTDPILKWLKQWWKNLFKRQPTVSHENGGSGYGWIMSAQMLLYVLVAVVASVLVIFLYRVWRGRRRTPTVLAEAIVPVPDITDENIRADQLPEDGWMNLARELLERGEFRLAMRAFYLATLAHLAGRNLISIARFKSNRDYQRELGRRAHSFQNLLIIYGDNLLVFERIWYGRHAVDRDLVGQFAANVEKIKGAG